MREADNSLPRLPRLGISGAMPLLLRVHGMNRGNFAVVSTFASTIHWRANIKFTTRGADKSFARPGRKQATATEDFEFLISFL